MAQAISTEARALYVEGTVSLAQIGIKCNNYILSILSLSEFVPGVVGLDFWAPNIKYTVLFVDTQTKELF